MCANAPLLVAPIVIKIDDAMSCVFSMRAGGVYPCRISHSIVPNPDTRSAHSSLRPGWRGRRRDHRAPQASWAAKRNRRSRPGCRHPRRQPTAAAAFKTTPIVFQYDSFNFDFLVTLGGTYERTADIGECYAVAAQIEDGNIQSWVTNWQAMADRLNGIGATAEAAGRNVSASEAYLRAANYYSAAQWYTLGTPTPDDITAVWTQTSRRLRVVSPHATTTRPRSWRSPTRPICP